MLHLDGRPVKTPGKHLLVAPTKALALALAAEWEWQVGAVQYSPQVLMRSKGAQCFLHQSGLRNQLIILENQWGKQAWRCALAWCSRSYPDYTDHACNQCAQPKGKPQMLSMPLMSIAVTAIDQVGPGYGNDRTSLRFSIHMVEAWGLETRVMQHMTCDTSRMLACA